MPTVATCGGTVDAIPARLRVLRCHTSSLTPRAHYASLAWQPVANDTGNPRYTCSGIGQVFQDKNQPGSKVVVKARR